MKRSALILALVASPVTASPPAAHAGEAACWFEAGVVVAPALVMGVAGDYLIDTGAPQTLLNETQAQGAGFAGAALRGEVRLAGLDLADRPVAVADLDARLRGLPTPVAGVIGADVLKAYVVDLRFSPCRLGIWPAGQAPAFHGDRVLPLEFVGGRPTAAAAVTDGDRIALGAFALATGSDAPVRLAEDLAQAPGAGKRAELLPDGTRRARLRALSFAGELFENLPSGLTAADPSGPAGEIGGPVLARFRLRFDFPAGQLLAAKEKGPPERSDEP